MITLMDPDESSSIISAGSSVSFQRTGTVVGGDGGAIDRASFERWYEDHHVPVFNYLARNLDPDTAEDLTAATFTEAWRARHTFDPERGTPIRWLLGIATNVMRAHLRQIGRRESGAVSIDGDGEAARALPDRAPTASDRFDEREALSIVIDELRNADAITREVVALLAVEELSYAAIAEIVGVPIGTVRSRLFRFRERLSVRMMGHGVAHDDRARRRDAR